MSDLAELVRDTRLAPAVLRVVLYVATEPDEWTEISATKWMLLFPGASERAVRNAVSCAVASGYVERKVGGRGHADSFRLPHSDHLNSFRLPHRDHLNFSLPHRGNLNSLSLPHRGNLRGSLSSTTTSTTSSTKEAGEFPLDVRAGKAIQGLEGCRGSLRDLLTTYCENPTEQYGLAQTVATWLQGGGQPGLFQMNDGSIVEDRASVVAQAINRTLADPPKKNAKLLKVLESNLRYVARYWLRETEASDDEYADQYDTLPG